MDGFAKYIVAIAKLTQNEEEAIEAVQKKLDELVNAQADIFLQVLEEKDREWGEVSRSVNKITKEIKAEVLNKKFKITKK